MYTYTRCIHIQSKSLELLKHREQLIISDTLESPEILCFGRIKCPALHLNQLKNHITSLIEKKEYAFLMICIFTYNDLRRYSDNKKSCLVEIAIKN